MKGENVIDKRLTFGMIFGRAESLNEQFFDEGVMRIRVERLVERQHGSRRLQAIPRHLQLGHGVDVLDEEFRRRSFGNVGEPQIQILLLFHLEIGDFVAVFHLANFVDNGHFIFTVHFGVALGVRHHVLQVGHQMARAESYASRREDQQTSLVDPIAFLGRRFVGFA